MASAISFHQMFDSMAKKWISCLFLSFVLLGIGTVSLAQEVSTEEKQFQVWLTEFSKQAIEKAHVRPEICEKIARHIHYDPNVLRAYRHQPEVVQTLNQYLKNVLSKAKIQEGRQHLLSQAPLLEAIEKKYKVDRHILLAIWGIESFYGLIQGHHNVAQALATLASSGVRTSFAQRELLILYKLINDNAVTLDQLKGSWAGAMGQVQFIPSSYERYAVDFDQDGRKDIWSSVSDALASIAAYLHALGKWQHQSRWGVEVRMDKQISDLPEGLEGLKQKAAPLEAWMKKGVRTLENQKSFPADLPKDQLYLLHFKEAGRSFLVSRNFSSILAYNHHAWYALAVGIMSDQILG